MIRNVLSHIGGVEVYGILSILLFFAFFTGMLVWAFRLKPGHLDAMGRIPLHDADRDVDPRARSTSTASSSQNPSDPSRPLRSSHECQ